MTGDLLAHSIDTAMWLNGPITRVVAKTETFVNERKHAVTGKVRARRDRRCLHVPRGVRATVRWGPSNRRGMLAAARTTTPSRLNGADGSVYFDLEEPEYLQYFEYTQQQSGKKTESHLTGWRKIHTTNSEHPYMNHYWVPGTTIGYEHTFLNALADFVMGIESGKPTQPDFRERAPDAAGVRCGSRIRPYRAVDGDGSRSASSPRVSCL